MKLKKQDKKISENAKHISTHYSQHLPKKKNEEFSPSFKINCGMSQWIKREETKHRRMPA